MENQWISFATDTANEGGSDSSMAGSKFVGLGTHLLKIDGVEQAVTRNGDPYYKITYVNKEGQTIMDRLYPLYGDNGTKKQSYKYKSLAHALVPEDGVLRFEFFTDNAGVLPSNPQLWTGLVGLFVEAEVQQGRRGYDVKDDGGVYRLYNVETKEFYELDGGVPNEFENFTQAREAAKAQGLFRAWNEINKFNASLEHVGQNHEVVSGLKASVSAGSL